jgi:hypothetical protein
MAGILSNPELVRHARMELRPRRMLIAATVVVLLYSLALMGFIQGNENRDAAPPHNHDYLQGLFAMYLVIQSILLCLWCLSACSQAIAGERMQKTYDFLRTTRLTSSELLLGMVAGIPSMAYFTIACSLPFSIGVGIAGGLSPVAILITYGMLVLVAVVISLAGLTISMMTERPRAGEILVLVFFFIWPWVALAFTSSGSPLPGLTAVSVIPGILQLYGLNTTLDNPFSVPRDVPFFAFHLPILFVSAVLYASLGAWLVVALVRNLKKERDEIRLLSHWQSIGFVAYLNLLTLALLDLRGAAAVSRMTAEQVASAFATGYLIFNSLILYVIGITLLTPAERLKTWWRRPASGVERYWSEEGPPWLWMIVCAAVVLVLFTGEIAASTAIVPVVQWESGHFAARLAIVLVYCIRDVLFLQWCLLTRMKNPVSKGILFLFLYYLTVTIVIVVFFSSDSERLMEPAFALVMPSGALAGNAWPTTLVGAGIQVVVSIVLLLAIERRISPKALMLRAV